MNGSDSPLIGTAGAAAGWEAGPVLRWLLHEGRLIPEPGRLVDALAERLLEAGAPLWRLRVSFRTIHPQVAAVSYTWRRGQRATETRVQHGVEQSPDYLGSPIQHVYETGSAARFRLDRLDPERHHPVLHELAAQGATDYLALPLRFSDGRACALLLATDVPAGFSAGDVARFEGLADSLATVLEVFAQRRIAAALLDTYVGPRTGSKVLAGLIRRGDGETIRAALWFSDLRDFTPLSERLAPREMLDVLNAYFELVAAAVTARGGEILRFIGDAMLIVFPVDGRTDAAAACRAALDAAQDAFASLGPINHRRRRAGECPLRFGVGLHFGEVIYGNVGAPARLDFTVMGPAVNRTARLEGLTKAVGVPLLLSAEFAGHLGTPLRSLGRHPMKGVPEPQEVFAPADADPP